MKQCATMAAMLLLGAAAGFFAGMALTQKRCNDRADAEIESVKQAFLRRDQNDESNPRQAEADAKKLDEIVTKAGYRDKAEPEPQHAPRVISPNEFGSIPEYEEVSLTYYADGVLTGDDDRPMSQIEIQMSVGEESLNHFGEYELDSVFVRNDRTKTDYEILMDQRSYAQVLNEKPYLKS